jgi:acid phosphatase (class A)
MRKFLIFCESSNQMGYTPGQRHRFHMKRPVTLFNNIESIVLPKPEKNNSPDLLIELQEVRDAMVVDDEKRIDNLKIDSEYINMLIDTTERFTMPRSVRDFLREVKRQIDTITLKLKYEYNRSRPQQIAELNGEKLTPLTSVDTPAFPSNHTVSGIVLAEIIKLYYPQVSKELDEIANRNADSRVELGVHFPSDVEAGRLLAKELMERFDKSQLPEKNLIEETLKYRQYSDVEKQAKKMASEMRKTIYIMQQTRTGEYEFATNRDEVRKLTRKGFETIEEVN